MNIYLDVDDVALAWHEAYIKKYDLPMPTTWLPYELVKDHLKDLSKQRSFWVTLRTKHFPNFRPAGYVSARGVPVQWTKDCLKLRNFPNRTKVRHVNWGESKIEVLKSLSCDLFIDDKYETFIECNKNGIPCLLMDTPQNRHFDTNLRIYNLDIKQIMKKYDLIKGYSSKQLTKK